MSNAALQRLHTVLKTHGRLAVAVSGGVDSMTLASVAFDVLGSELLVVHAVSPAVPAEATKRVREHVQRLRWPYRQVNAGEFADTDYIQNPVNRCYYCKSSLYARLSDVWDGTIASGANLDDLGDYRPGLLAAKEKRVVHPLIEASIDKATVRALARLQPLVDVAEQPAQPCLSSRIETGIAINADDLLFVHRVERYLSDALGAADLRCRITAAGVRIEVPEPVQQADAVRWRTVVDHVTRMVHEDDRPLAGFSAYQRGSAFLHPVVSS